MDARFACMNTGSRCCAVACSSARIRPVLDAAIILVVSICVICVQIITQLS